MSDQLFDVAGEVTGGAQGVMAGLAAEGFRQRAAMGRLERLAVMEANGLIAAVSRGEHPPVFLQEAFQPHYQTIQTELEMRYPNLVKLRETMKVTDFSGYLTTPILNVMLWGGYTSSVNPVMPLVKKTVLTDFKPVVRLQIDGDGSPFEEDRSDGQSPAPEGHLNPVPPIQYTPKSYAKKMSISWKALLMDNFGIFNQLTDWLLVGWKNTVWDWITNKYWDADGPNVLLYNAANTNQIITANGASMNNPPLTFQGIADGYNVLENQLGPDGQPIEFTGTLYLVVPPALAITAKALKNSVMNQLSIFGGANNSTSGFPEVRLNVGKGVLPDFEIIVDKRIPKVVTSGTVMNTAWELVYDPSVQPRPTVELGMLREFDVPTVWQRVPDTMSVGGAANVRMGAFDSGNIDYKSVLVMGGAYGSGKSTVASTGQGS